MEITKLGGAKSQIRHAIELYFNYGDDVVIHAVINGAHQVLCDLASPMGIESVKESVISMFPERDPKKVMSDLNEVRNFLKHADKKEECNPNSTIEFDESVNELLMLDATALYEKISGEVDPLMRIFNVWMVTCNPLMLKSLESKKLAERLSSFSYSDDRQRFLGAAKVALGFA